MSDRVINSISLKIVVLLIQIIVFLILNEVTEMGKSSLF